MDKVDVSWLAETRIILLSFGLYVKLIDQLWNYDKLSVFKFCVLSSKYLITVCFKTSYFRCTENADVECLLSGELLGTAD